MKPYFCIIRNYQGFDKANIINLTEEEDLIDKLEEGEDLIYFTELSAIEKLIQNKS